MHCVVFKNSHNETLCRNIHSCKTQRDELAQRLMIVCSLAQSVLMYPLQSGSFRTFLFIPRGQTFPPFKGAGDYKAQYLQTKWLVRFVLAVILIAA